MKNVKIIFLTLVSFSILGCAVDDANEIDQLEDNRTRYTFSQFEEVDFMVASGGYQVLYDYSIPIDTLFGHSGAHLFGEDSIIYLQVRSDLDGGDDQFLGTTDHYFGELTGLKMYNGKKTISIDLPYFYPMFSAFSLHGDLLYYWGCGEELYACSYNFKSKKFKKKLLSREPVGTDFFGSFEPPVFDEAGNAIFKCHGAGKTWILNPALTNIIEIRQ